MVKEQFRSTRLREREVRHFAACDGPAMASPRPGFKHEDTAGTPGQRGDSPMLGPLLAHLAVARIGPGRPRTRPDALFGDKAYSSRGIRAMLRARGVRAVIPQPSDQIAHRKRRGSAGGRPPRFDSLAYEGRNVIERSFNDHKQW